MSSRSSNVSSGSQGGRPHAVYNLYHIPRSLINFTSDYLTKLFSAVDKPHDSLKQPTLIDNRQFPEFKYFIQTLLINGCISADTLVHALIYLSRFHRRIPRRQPLVEEGAKHKIFLAALLVASKFCDDRYPLATISVCEFLPRGLFTLAEVNRMERAFLSVIRYKLIVNPEELSLLLLKHGIDIKQIARVIAEKTNSRGYVSMPPSGALQHLPHGHQGRVAAPNGVLNGRAVAGHSASSRPTSSNGIPLISSVLSTATMGTARLAPASMSGANNVLHNAYLETVAKRTNRPAKPLPAIQPRQQQHQQQQPSNL